MVIPHQNWLTRPRRQIRRALCAGATALFLLSGVCPAEAETLADLEGLSIDLNYVFHLTSISLNPDSDHLAKLRTFEREIKIYVSTKGNIFEFPVKAPNNWNYVPMVFTIDKAQDLPEGQMVTWTMMNGHLTKVIKEIQGFWTLSLAISPQGLSCVPSWQNQPDAQTGKLVGYVGNIRFEYQAQDFSIASYTCTVKKGNIFAPNGTE